VASFHQESPDRAWVRRVLALSAAAYGVTIAAVFGRRPWGCVEQVREGGCAPV